MGVNRNLWIIMQSYETDAEKEFSTKSISKAYRRATAMPTAWELSIDLGLNTPYS